MAAARVDSNVRYEPDERPPFLVVIGAGFQAAMIIVAPVVLTVVIVARIAAQPDGYISWAVFAALLIAGATTVLQAARVGRVGAGHVLIMGTSGAFIAVCVAALMEGGPTMMASLIVVSSLFQFALAARLSLLRRIFTPAVSGTVIMLIPVTVMPIVFDSLKDVPDGASPAAAPATAVATLVVIAGAYTARPAGVAAMVAAHRNSGGLFSRGPLRAVRHGACAGSALGGRSPGRVAGIRPDSGCKVLGAPACVRGGHPGGRHRDHWRRSSHSARLPAHTAGDRFPCGAGCAQR